MEPRVRLEKFLPPAGLTQPRISRSAGQDRPSPIELLRILILEARFGKQLANVRGLKPILVNLASI